jgi:heme transport system ATP-binding protein
MKATDIRVRIGRKEILHGVDFEAVAGEVTAIIGPNGSGKSTLLKAMTGEVSYEGTVELNGQDIQTLQPWELAPVRGVLPQSAAVAFPFTVLEIVRLGLMDGWAAQERTLPSHALARVGLAGFENRFFQDLSGGEQQRVQLARVLAQVWQPVIEGTPRWLFLDEPVASLDIAHQFTVLDVARAFADQGGGVVLVMHDLNLTAMFADQISVIHAGRVHCHGSPHQTLTQDMLREVYGCALDLNTVPSGRGPFLLPQMRQMQV